MKTYATKPKPVPEQAVELSNRSSTKDEFAKRLYEALEKKGWNQSQLARYAGLGRDAISTYIRGRSIPSPSSLNKLAQVLGCRPEELMPNYFEKAAEEQTAKMELREIHGEDGYMWLKVNMRLPKATALRVLMLINEADN
jgi:transcriptional regulator with XRE-family HTH domain